MRHGRSPRRGGCQHISVLRLLAGAEVEEVIAWAVPQEALVNESDDGLIVNGLRRLPGGIECPVFAQKTSSGGVDDWTADSLVRWSWGPPELYKGFDVGEVRVRLDHQYQRYCWSQHSYLTGSVRSFLPAVETGGELAIPGHDLHQALEVAISAKHSAFLGSVPVKLPSETASWRCTRGSIGGPVAMSRAGHSPSKRPRR